MEKLYENAFKVLNLLEEEDFELDAIEDNELKDFLDDEEEETVDIIDPMAEDEEDVKDSYMDKVVLECSVCHSLIYKDPSEIVEDDESEDGLVNVGDECPYCMSTDGYKIVGQIAPYETTDVTVEVEPKDEEEVEVEDETEEVTESFKRKRAKKSLNEFLNFKTMPIPKEGSTFAFKATVDEPEVSRLLQKKNLKFDKVNDNGTIVWLIGHGDTDHIATYVPSTKTLYTDKRELFRESYMTNESLNEDTTYRDLYFGGIIFKLKDAEDKKMAEQLIDSTFDGWKDGKYFNIDGGFFKINKTKSGYLLKYFGNIGSIYYEEYFKDFIRKMKSAGIEITYEPKYSELELIFDRKDHIDSLDNEQKVQAFLNSKNESFNEAFDINSMSRIKLIDAIDKFYREDEMLFSDNYITDDDKTMEDILDENGASEDDSDPDEGFYHSMSNEQLKNVFQIIRNYLKTRDEDEYNSYSSDIYSTFKLKRGWIDESFNEGLMTYQEWWGQVDESPFDVAKEFGLSCKKIKSNGDEILYEFSGSPKAFDLAREAGYFYSMDLDESLNDRKVMQEGLDSIGISLNEKAYTKDELWNKFGTYDLDIINAGNEEDVTLAEPKYYKLQDEGYYPYIKWVKRADDGSWVMWGGSNSDKLDKDFLDRINHPNYPNKAYNIENQYIDAVVLPEGEKPLDESLENLDIETEHDKIHIEAEEKTDDDEEMIVPIEPEVKDEIEDNSELANSEEEPDKEDVDIEEFDEESFDELGESFLKKHYSNVNSFKTTKIMDDGNNLFVEGLITFNSGSKKNTSFKFTPSTIRNNKVKFFGENLQINNGKKAFKLNGRLDNNKLIAESLTYNYIAKNQKNESKRISGTVSLKEAKVGKDLSKKEGSMSNIIEKNLNKINASTSKDDLLNNLTKIFKDNGLNTEASNRLLSNVEKSKSFKAALSTVYNSYLAGSNLAVDRK